MGFRVVLYSVIGFIAAHAQKASSPFGCRHFIPACERGNVRPTLVYAQFRQVDEVLNDATAHQLQHKRAHVITPDSPLRESPEMWPVWVCKESLFPMDIVGIRSV